MFDYIHTDIKDKTVSEILSNQLLDFNFLVSTSTGEINPMNRERKKSNFPIKSQQKADLNGMTISLTNDTYINLEGSLHEFYHGNNYGNFTLGEVKMAIESICKTLDINSSLTPLHNLEFGVNILLPFPVATFLNSIYSFKGQRPERNSYSGKGLMIKFFFSQYELKLYDKGTQRGLDANILRVEIKVRRMQYLQAKGLHIRHLSDLLNESYHLELGGLLVSSISYLVIGESGLDKNKMSCNEKRLYKECNNPLYWIELWNTNPLKYRKRFTRFKQIISKYGPLKIQSTALGLIVEKWQELTSTSSTEITGVKSNDTSAKNELISTSSSNITLQVIGNKQPLTIERRCKSCGRDISHQHPRSVFCSEKIFGADGKKCRNWDSNPRNNFKRREKLEQDKGLLFDTTNLIVNEEFRNFSINSVCRTSDAEQVHGNN